MSARVVVVGSVNVDLTVAVAALPGPGETVAGGRYEERDGGKGANQAVAAARAGASTRFVGAVGDDAHGARARTALVAAGVDVGALASVEAATGVALIVIGADGENQIAVASGANHALEVAGLELGGDGVLLLGLEVLDAPLLAAASAARTAGWRIVLNPAPARPFDPALERGALLTPNQHEAATLTGLDDSEAAARALAERTGAPVVVTLGAAGALLLEDGAVTRVPAPEVEAVDTTGAGDVFSGALAAALAGGAALRDAVARAVMAAARSVERPGTR